MQGSWEAIKMNKASSLPLRILQSKKVKWTTIINGRLWWIGTESHENLLEQIKVISSGWIKEEFPKEKPFTHSLERCIWLG